MLEIWDQSLSHEPLNTKVESYKLIVCSCCYHAFIKKLFNVFLPVALIIPASLFVKKQPTVVQDVPGRMKYNIPPVLFVAFVSTYVKQDCPQLADLFVKIAFDAHLICLVFPWLLD